jgi:hypothetical protein
LYSLSGIVSAPYTSRGKHFGIRAFGRPRDREYNLKMDYNEEGLRMESRGH